MIRIETERFVLSVGEDCLPRSLILKKTGEECLADDQELPLFSVTLPRPFNNEVKLSHPNKRTTFPANRLRREGNQLIVGFDIAPFEAVIEVKEAPGYAAFTLADFRVPPEAYPGLCMKTPPVLEMRLLQLPIRPRERFGEWLNVAWDERAAVCVLAAGPEARIDSETRPLCRVLTADAARDVRLKGTGAALIADETARFLDDVESFEADFGLPRGVKSRRGEMINASAYWTGDITPENVDEHIRYAKMGGFRMMLIYYTAIFKTGVSYDTCGNYDDCDYRDEYPNGWSDLRDMLARVKSAGITPGIHFLQTHIGIRSRYVTPVADHRLHKTRRFTLSRPLSAQETELFVEEDPADAVLCDRCRVLQFGGELIGYEGYTTERPYRFTGCTRGLYDTAIQAHAAGEVGGLLDVSEFGHGHSVYLDQDSSLADEIADKLAKVYSAGFEYAYFDGSEGVNEPFEYNVPRAQYRVYKKLDPEPLYCEGAAKAHFSWHMFGGGNAFDVFRPEEFKEMIRRFPAEEAPRMRCDFTRLNFGWWAFCLPAAAGGDETHSVCGTQTDMLEYATSRAAAWDCPATLMGNLSAFKQHPRTGDILEALRRWEDVRAKNWLTQAQKDELKNLDQEHILLINEAGEYELAACERLPYPDERVIVYRFERNGEDWLVYWHRDGEGVLRLPLKKDQFTLLSRLGGEPLEVTEDGDSCLLPAGNRRYVRGRDGRTFERRLF